jgi:amidase
MTEFTVRQSRWRWQQTMGLVAVAIGTSRVLPAQATTPPPLARLVGEWIFEMDGDAQPQRVRLELAGDSLRGNVYGTAFTARLNGRQLSFPVGDFRWRATVRGDTLLGWLGMGTADSSRWTGTRVVVPALARRLVVAPIRFPRAFASQGEPVARLYPGDTVQTSTLDAGGWGPGAFGDRANKRAMGGNPLIGPFVIEGTVPGDVLVVRLHRVQLNRDWAFSGTSLMESAIEPNYAVDRKEVMADNKWILDRTTNTARLKDPSPALREYRVPVRPFLGVVGVAPGGEWVPSSRESGDFGGNMENARLGEGATVLLPVSSTGAYLYIGDGHAAQGDGELTGDAMETSLDVTFSVDVIRWGFQTITRAEDDEFVMSLGVGGSTDQALRRATSDMARWLEKRFEITSTDAALLMGFSLSYSVPDIVPPGFGVTARMPKRVLAALRIRSPK